MKLIFIRHAEPDYSIDSLTEKGFREASFLAERTKSWKVNEVFCSPLGRAVETSKPSLKNWNMTATTYDWLREFHAPVSGEGRRDNRTIPWDFLPEYLNEHPELLDNNNWFNSKIMVDGNVKAEYDRVCRGIDSILSKYGYERDGLSYTTHHIISSSDYMIYNGTTIECMKNSPNDEPVLVFFCHLGVMLAIISHLINTSPVTLWQGIFTPPSSVTVLSAEERYAGSVYFRAQAIGDTTHLYTADEPVSFYGGFAPPFHG